MSIAASGPEEYVKVLILTAAFIAAQGFCFAAGYHQLVAGPGGTIYFRLNSTPINEVAYSVAQMGGQLKIVRLDTPVTTRLVRRP